MWKLSIAIRYLLGKGFSSILTLFCIFGVALGVATLMIVLGVMNGFERDLRNKILGVNAHLFILPLEDSITNYEEVIDRVRRVKETVACAPFVEGQGILISQYGAKGVAVRGIEYGLETHVTNLAHDIERGKAELGEEEIIIGKELARELGVKVGESVMLLSSPKIKIKNFNFPSPITPMNTELKVGAIFKSGMYEYDSGLVYIKLSKAQQIFGLSHSVSGVAVRVKDLFSASSVGENIQRILGTSYLVRSWQEMNRNLFSALKLEKVVMFIILALIVLVAVFNIASVLIMTVVEKTKEIGILRAMGARQSSLTGIFVWKGLLIGIIGTLIGLGGGIIGCWILSRYQFIKLPSDIYYISTIPVSLNYEDVLFIILAAIILSLLATIYPAKCASKVDLIRALRHE